MDCVMSVMPYRFWPHTFWPAQLAGSEWWISFERKKNIFEVKLGQGHAICDILSIQLDLARWVLKRCNLGSLEGFAEMSCQPREETWHCGTGLATLHWHNLRLCVLYSWSSFLYFSSIYQAGIMATDWLGVVSWSRHVQAKDVLEFIQLLHDYVHNSARRGFRQAPEQNSELKHTMRGMNMFGKSFSIA